MITTYRGTIQAFHGTWMSGLATLVIERADGARHDVLCDNAPTVRALEGCFGNFIAPGHTINNEAIAGKEVVYSVDGIGVLLGFSVPDSWIGPEIPAEGLEEEE